MYAKNILAVSGLIAFVAATPLAGQHHQHLRHHRARDIVWETATEEVVVTVPVTKTVWIEPGQTPAAHEHHEPAHGYAPPAAAPAAPSPDVQPAAYSAPSVPSSPEVAPTPSSVYTPPAPPAPPAESSAEASPVAPAPVAPAPVEPSPSQVYTPPAAPAYTPETSAAPVYVAPTTSEYVAPTTSAYVAPSAPAAPAPYEGGNPGSCKIINDFAGPTSNPGVEGLSYGMGKAGTSYTGELTYFQQGMGACGKMSADNDLMVAVGEELFDSYGTANPNANPLCGKWITINGAGGKKWSAQILDRCPGCTASNLDLPEAFFNAATNCADGRAHGITWSFD